MNRSGDAAMFGYQRIKRSNGGRVAQDDGNLSALRAVCGLTVGFGLLHGSLTRSEEGAERFSGDERANQFAMLSREILPPVTVFANQAHGRPERDGLALAEVVQRKVAVSQHHGGFHVGPIPTMCQSYTVTSDVSTTCRREAA